jgi:REP element-mobilizing transposase RayT
MLVFGVKHRYGLISPQWQDKLYAVISQIAKEQQCKVMAIGGIKDHVHILLSIGGQAPDIATITRNLKSLSSKWINDNRLCMGRFAWQRGSGKFSYSYRDLSMITNYIANQEKHHYTMGFREEIRKLLEASGCQSISDDCLPEELE